MFAIDQMKRLLSILLPVFSVRVGVADEDDVHKRHLRQRQEVHCVSGVFAISRQPRSHAMTSLSTV